MHMRIDVHHHFDDAGCECCRPRRRILWTIGPVSEQPLDPGPEKGFAMLQLTDSQQCDLAIAPVDRKGKAAKVQDGSTTWTSSDETVATVEAGADGLTATVKAVDLGTCQVNVSADADLGDGVSSLSGSLDVTVVGGQAVSLSVSTGVPSEQA